MARKKLLPIRHPENIANRLQKVSKKDDSPAAAYFFSIVALIAGFFWASYYVAKATGFNDELGWQIHGVFYWPFAWIIWLFSDWARPLTEQTLIRAFSPGFITLAIGVMFYRLYNLRNSETREGLHGSAQLAEIDDLKTAGLLDNDGAIIGGYQDIKGQIHPLRHASGEHILAYAPTGSGKGVSLVLPTLLSWNQSVVCLDIKGENYNLSAGWRQKYLNSKIIKFDPASPGSDGYNPLLEIRLGTEFAIADTQNVARMLVDSEGEGLKDHWDNTSFAFLQGLILFECEMAKRQNIYPEIQNVAKYLTDPDRDADELFEEMLDCGIEFIQQSARGMMNKPEKERGSVFSTSETRFTLYRDPIIGNNLVKPSFKIDDLQCDDNPVSLYVIIRPKDIARIAPLTRLLFSQILEKRLSDMSYENGRSKGEYNYQLLMMMDEFTSQGKLEIISKSIAFSRSYGVKFFLIIQDTEQLIRAYGQNEEITGNCHIRIAYAPNKLATAELLSSMSGETTIERKIVTKSGSRTGVLNQVSESIDYVKRPLMTPDEIMRLPMPIKTADGSITEPGDMLIFSAGTPLIYGKQYLYFFDPILSARAKVSPPISVDQTDRQPLSAPAFMLDTPETQVINTSVQQPSSADIVDSVSDFEHESQVHTGEHLESEYTPTDDDLSMLAFDDEYDDEI